MRTQPNEPLPLQRLTSFAIGHSALALALTALLGAAAFVPSAQAGLFTPVVLRDIGTNSPLDLLLATNGTPFAAANFGSSSTVERNDVTFPAAGVAPNPAGVHWSAVASTVDTNLGGFIAIDPLFFSEIWGGNPISVTVSNLNPARVYLVQILHGEPRACCAGTFTNNTFQLSTGNALAVPSFTLGNGVPAENPPATLDRAIVEVELGDVTAFTYRMFGGVGRGPSIAGFQVRELPGFTNVPIADLPGVSDSSVAWGDYDNDGRLDFLLTGSGDSQLWRNTGSTFTNVPIAGLPGVSDSSVAWGDYDNDSRLDFLLTGSGFSQLWRNTGSGFTDVTASVAPGLPGVDSSSVAWGDYDNDGRLDFLLTGVRSSAGPVSQLWRNTGSAFTNVPIAGLPNVYKSCVAWGDYDNDGHLDFLLTGSTNSSSRVSQLWRNTGSGFTNVTASVAPGLPGVDSSSVAWGDYDHDGRLDFLLTGLTNSTRNADVSQLWRNTGSGFTNVTASVAPGLAGVTRSSVAWGDYDDDGRLDFLLTGSSSSQLWRNIALVTNTPPSAPTNLTVAAGSTGLTFSWGAAADVQTPANGLAYHLRVGTTPGGSDLLAPMAATNGQARLPRAGALQPARSRTLTGLPTGRTLYWSVQAADTAFAGSPFAAGQSFTLGLTLTPPTGMAIPGDTNGDGVVSQTEFAAVRGALTNELATLNAAGYYTPAQVQALNVGTPLLSQANGQFKLTLGVQKAKQLTNFVAFPFVAPQTTINAQGKLEFLFTSPDNAAFYRLTAE